MLVVGLITDSEAACSQSVSLKVSANYKVSHFVEMLPSLDCIFSAWM